MVGINVILMRHRIIIPAAVAALLVSCAGMQDNDNAPRNVALNRMAFASSSYDYNLTAQLATDGIVETQMPPYIGLATGRGDVPRNEREWLFDMKTNTRMEFSGAGETITLSFNNYLPEFDNILLVAELNPGREQDTYYGAPGQEAGQILSDVVRSGADKGRTSWAVCLLGSSDGEQWSELDRAVGRGSRICETLDAGDGTFSRFRLELASDRNCDWQIKDWDFCRDGFEIVPDNGLTEVYRRENLSRVLPSEFFSSSWMSLGAGEEWIYVDLGAKCRIREVITHWLNGVPEGEIQVSDDAVEWKGISDMSADAKVRCSGRYVRLLCTGGGPYVLSELEVIGRGGLVAKPKPQPEAAGGRLDLQAGNWKLLRAGDAGMDGCRVASEGFDDSEWLVATVPGTVLATYQDIGAIPDPNWSDNQLQISESFFASDFWYRDEFTLPAGFEGRRLLLNFDGINWKAEVFVNGTAVGRIEGAFMRGRFDVTELLHEGTNAIAVRIIRNDIAGSVKEQTQLSPDSNGGPLGGDNPTFHATVGWDWIPTIRGRDIGIWNDVYLTASGDVTVEDPFVRSVFEDGDLKSAGILISAGLFNRGGGTVSGRLNGRFADLPFSVDVTLAPGERKTVEVPALRLDSPELWWPAGYGDPHLYDVDIRFENDGEVSDSKSFKFGVREMTYDDSDGILKVYVNGRRFVGRGGNWGFSESNLRYRSREYDAAVRYHADMNFTLIRNWVGQVGDEEFYEACDRHGVMIWQDFWLANPWDGPDPYDEDMFVANASDYIRRIRNHAAMCIYCGRNEGMPTPTLNGALDDLVRTLHPGLHYIPHSAAGMVSGGGPYRALPVRDYFNLFGNDRMHSERGMPCVMNYENLVRTIPEDRIWPQSNLWGLHDFTLGGAQYAESFNEMLLKGFGAPKDAREFAQLAQWINYNGYRAIFESRSDHRRGMLLWMSHPCWPSLVWQTYDYFFDPTGAYFGCKKACEPLHIQFNGQSGNVEVVNYSAGDGHKAVASAEILDMEGIRVWSREMQMVSDEDSTVECFHVDVPEDAGEVYFIRLKLVEDDVVSENFYWQGREPGNWQALRNVPEAAVSVKVETVRKEDGMWLSEVRVSNTSGSPALMLRLKAVDKSGRLVAPVLYSDNYFFLMPGESRTVEVKIDGYASERGPRFEIEGFNIR